MVGGERLKDQLALSQVNYAINATKRLLLSSLEEEYHSSKAMKT
jgi:hypothetical protein